MRFFEETFLETLLEPQISKKGSRKLSIGLLKETDTDEHRIAITPEGVGNLAERGHCVLVERSAGEAAGYSDLQYSEEGAYIVPHQEVFKADLILKINPLTVADLDLMSSKQIVFSFMPEHLWDAEMLRKMMQKRITAISYSEIEDEHGHKIILDSLEEIAGLLSVQIAAECLDKTNGGKGVLLGGITGISPTEIVIIGANTAAEFAARSAIAMGNTVKIFDNSIPKLQSIQQRLNVRLNTSVFHPRVFQKALRTADALIVTLAASDNEDKMPIIKESHLGQMKRGSVIVDITADGCETSRIRTLSKPIYFHDGVVHYSVPNITSRVPRTASIALSNILSDLVSRISVYPSTMACLKANPALRKAAFIFNGILTSAQIGERFGLPYQNINLLLSAL